MRYRILACALASFALAGACLAANPASPHQEKTPQVRIVTRLVTLNVIVQDKNGRPVAGPSRKDFSVYDGGRKQKIAYFETPNPQEAGRPFVQEPPDVYSNIGAGGGPPGVIIILVDSLNMDFTAQYYAREAVIRFLEQIPPNQRVAIYLLGMHLTVLHDFTSDVAGLITALRKSHVDLSHEIGRSTRIPPMPEPPGLAGQALQALNASIKQGAGMQGTYFGYLRFDITLGALNQIAERVAGAPGRKSLIWLTGSLPFCFCEADQSLGPSQSREVNATRRLLSSENLAVYPVDARGLMVGESSTDFAMKEVAKATGGVAFHDTNDILGSVRRAAQDADDSYVLGYYPSGVKWNGKFRKVEVKVSRPGLRVRTQSGYYATATLPVQVGNLAQIAKEPLEETAVPLTVKVAPEPPSKPRRIRLFVAFDPKNIHLADSSLGRVASLELGLFQESATGKILASRVEGFKLLANGAPSERPGKESLGLTVPVPLFPAASRLVLVLRDETTGAIGSIDIPLEKYQREPAR